MRQLAAVERAVAEGAGRAPNLHALRNAIGDLLEPVELIDLRGSNPFGSGMVTGGFVPGDRPNAVLEDAPRRATRCCRGSAGRRSTWRR